METTIRTNIGGYIFNLEQSAYNMLETYLNQIKASFASPEEAEEISNDIEFRVAELLKEQAHDEDSLVEPRHVQQILDVLGYPDVDEPVNMSVEADETGKVRKKLFRHPNDRYLGGVSAGIGLYFGLNANIVRGIFVFLALVNGFGVLLYGVLWAILPEARSRVQLLQMSGKKASFNNLEDMIEEEAKALKNSFATLKESKGFKQFPEVLNKILSVILALFVFVFKAIAFLFAIIFLIISTSLLFVFAASLFMPESVFSPVSWFSFPLQSDFYQWIFPMGGVIYLKAGLFLFVGIPSFFILLASIRILFNLPNKNKKWIRVIGLIAWLFGLFTVISFGLSQKKAFAAEAEDIKEIELKTFNYDTLYIESKQLPFETLKLGDAPFEINNATWILEDEKPQLVGKARVYLKNAEDNQFRIKTIFRASEQNHKKALRESENIEYDWQQKDSAIYLANFFQLKNKNKVWKNQGVQVFIYVPEGKYIKLMPSTDELRIYGVYPSYWNDAANVWKATKDDFLELGSEDDASEVIIEPDDSLSVNESEMLDEMKEELKEK